MALTEYQELLEEMRKLLEEIKKEPEGSRPFVVCIEGTNRAFFNIY